MRDEAAGGQPAGSSGCSRGLQQPCSRIRNVFRLSEGPLPTADTVACRVSDAQWDSKEVPVHCRFDIGEDGGIWSRGDCPALDQTRARECGCVRPRCGFPKAADRGATRLGRNGIASVLPGLERELRATPI